MSAPGCPRRLPRLVGAALLLLIMAASGAGAQESGRDPNGLELPVFPLERFQQPAPMGGVDVIELRRRLGELDRLLLLGSAARAATVLDDLAQHSALTRELVPRRIRLEQLRGDHVAAAALCRRAVTDEPRNPALWRELATSLLALDQPDSARLALDRFLALSPIPRSSGLVAVGMLRGAGRPAAALALIDSLRGVLREPRFQGLERAAVLLAVDRQEDAAEEAHTELVAEPYNLALLRTALLEGPSRPGGMDRFIGRLLEAAQRPNGTPAGLMLAANLQVVEGRSAAAIDLVGPLADRPDGALLLLQNAVVLLRERDQDPLGSSPTAEAQGTVDFLLGVLERLIGGASGAPSLRGRAADLLAETCELALSRGLLGADPQAAAARFDELLGRVRLVSPDSEYLY